MALQALDLGTSASADGSAVAARRPVGGLRVTSLLAASFITLVIGQLGRVPVLSAGAKEAPVLLNDLVVAGTVLVGLWVALRGRRLGLDGVSIVALAFAAVGGISALLAMPRFDLSWFEVGFSLAYLLRWLVYLGIYLVIINELRPGDVRRLLGVLEGAVLVFAAFGILQSLFLPGFAQIVFPNAELYTQWDPQGRRLVSTFLDPNLAGGLILVILLLMIARMASGDSVPLWKPGLLLGALVLTLSRGSLLAFAVGLGVMALFIRRVSWRTLAWSGLAFIGGLIAAPWLWNLATAYNKLSLQDPSLLLRFVAWGRAIQVLTDHPIVGVGFNTYGFVQLRYGFAELSQSAFGLDGGLLFIAVMTGVTGVGLYVTFLWLVLRGCGRLWRSSRAHPGDRAVGLGVSAATVALVFHSLFVNSLLYPPIMHTMWTLWGMTFVLRRTSTEQESRA